MKGRDLADSSLSLLLLVVTEGDAEPQRRICYAAASGKNRRIGHDAKLSLLHTLVGQS